ncbi:MAG TPA: OmpA family protein [Candidatus Kapabacteria bacterium]|nr:OmpA family protein [Candidatus Kapabacteria bacterium]
MVNRVFYCITICAWLACAGKSSGQTAASQVLLGVEGGVTYSRLLGGENFGFRYEYPFGDFSNAMLRFSSLGSGLAGFGGLRLQIPLSRRFGLITGLQDVELTSGNAQTITRSAAPEITGPGEATVSETYASRWSYTTVEVLLRYILFPSWLYAFAGGSTAILTGDGFDASQQILSGGQFENLPSGTPAGSSYVQLKNFWSNHYYNLMRGAISFGIGSMLPLPIFGTLVLTPEIAINIPFLNLFGSLVRQIYASEGISVPNLFYGTFGLTLSTPLTTGEDWEPPLAAAREETNREGTAQPFSTGSITNKNVAPTAPRVVMVSGTVRDETSGLPIAASLTAFDLTHGARIAIIPSDSLGHFTLPLTVPGHYSITAESPNHLFRSIPLDLTSSADAIHLAPFDLANLQGRTQLLIFFGYDNATLSSESYPELLRVVDLLTADPDMNIEIDGHTDSEGSQEYNQTLSEARARAVRNFLIIHGIAVKRITALGFGKLKPIASNETEEGRAQNRRVEMKVIQ